MSSRFLLGALCAVVTLHAAVAAQPTAALGAEVDLSLNEFDTLLFLNLQPDGWMHRCSIVRVNFPKEVDALGHCDIGSCRTIPTVVGAAMAEVVHFMGTTARAIWPISGARLATRKKSQPTSPQSLAIIVQLKLLATDRWHAPGRQS